MVKSYAVEGLFGIVRCRTASVYFMRLIGVYGMYHPQIVLISLRLMHFRLTMKHFSAGYIARAAPFAFFFQESILGETL